MAKTLNKKINYWKVRLLMFLAVVGPGIITGTADNDAGGVTTYSVVGANFGYKMLWILVLITVMLYVTQEMGARLGVVTGKGLGDLIREKFSINVAMLLMVLVFFANFSNVLANVVGIASVADIYHIPRILFVPIFVVAVWYIILKGSFSFVQNIFMTSCLLFFCYIINGFMSKPDIPQMISGSIIPSIEMSRDYIFTATALIGTTLTVWGQVFIQSYFVDKGIEKKHMKNARLDVLFGAFWTDFVAYFIIISAAATLFVSGARIETAVDAATALGPALGSFAKHLFAWGLLNASLLGMCVISMSTAYFVAEIIGREGKVSTNFKEAPLFYSIIGGSFFACMLLVFIPNLPMVYIMTASQAVNTFILPAVFFILLKLINDKKLMGSYVNSRTMNIIAWVTIVSFVVISLVMLYLMFF